MFKEDKLYNWIDSYLPAYLVVALPGFYLGTTILDSIIKVIGFILTFFLVLKVIRRNKCKFKSLFNLYLFLYIGSIICYTYNGVSIKCYMNEVFNSIPAILMVYIGMGDPNRNRRFYDRYLLVCSISMLIGIFLYLTMPGWYITRLVEAVNNTWHAQAQYSEDEFMEVSRFSSYLGDTYIIDVYTMFGLAIGLFEFYQKKYIDKKLLTCSIVMLVSAILTQQRVAMVCSVATVLFYLVYGNYKGRKTQTTFIITTVTIIVVFVITVAVLLFADRMETLTLLMSDRMDNMSVGKALNERNYQIKLLTDHWDYYLFGHGIGSGGSVARSLGYHAVSDCSYIELIYETGIIGFLIFITLILMTLLRCLKYMRYYLTEAVIITFVMVAMIGSNTLTIGYLSIIPFWYAIGRVWNKNYFDYAVTNNLKI